MAATADDITSLHNQSRWVGQEKKVSQTSLFYQGGKSLLEAPVDLLLLNTTLNWITWHPELHGRLEQQMSAIFIFYYRIEARRKAEGR